MRKYLLAFCLSVPSLFAVHGAAYGAQASLSPANLQGSPGDMLSVDVVVDDASGLGTDLVSLDLDIDYPTALLGFDSAAFAPALDANLTFGGFTDLGGTIDGGGGFFVAPVTLSSGMTLATLNFQVAPDAPVATDTLHFGLLKLGFAEPVIPGDITTSEIAFLDSALDDATIETQPVPAPASLWLLALGAVAVVWVSSRGKRPIELTQTSA